MKFKKMDIKDRLKEKNDAWKEEHPMAGWGGPWCWHYLEGPETKNSFGKRWLNPANQDYVPSGYFSDEDLERWLNEDNTFLLPGKTFAELKEYCEVGVLTGTYMERDLKMMHHPAAYIERFSAAALKNQMDLSLIHEHYYSSKKKFNKHFIKELDGHIKAMIYDYFAYWDMSKILKNDFTIDRETRDKIYYFLRGLSQVGIGYWKYSNTPQERENFSYYKDFLVHEVLGEIYSKKRVRKYKDYYVIMNRSSTTVCTTDLWVDGHSFPYTIEMSCPEKDVTDFDEIFTRAKELIDSRENRKFFKAFRKNPVGVSFSIIKQAIR